VGERSEEEVRKTKKILRWKGKEKEK
jgi:hypothetical protein